MVGFLNVRFAKTVWISDIWFKPNIRNQNEPNKICSKLNKTGLEPVSYSKICSKIRSKSKLNRFQTGLALFGLELVPNQLFSGRPKSKQFSSVWTIYKAQTEHLKSERNLLGFQMLFEIRTVWEWN